MQGLRRFTAAQLHQLGIVRQIQLRQQASKAAVAAQQQQEQVHVIAHTKAEQQAQVLAVAAEVAQQVRKMQRDESRSKAYFVVNRYGFYARSHAVVIT